MQSIINALIPLIRIVAEGLLTLIAVLAIDAIRKALLATEDYLKTQANKTDNEHLRAAARMAVDWIDQTLSTVKNTDKLSAAIQYLSDSLPFSATEKELIVAIEAAVKEGKPWAVVSQPVPPLVLPAVETPAVPLVPIS